jgi:hypothetical protein
MATPTLYSKGVLRCQPLLRWLGRRGYKESYALVARRAREKRVVSMQARSRRVVENRQRVDELDMRRGISHRDDTMRSMSCILWL